MATTSRYDPSVKTCGVCSMPKALPVGGMQGSLGAPPNVPHVYSHPSEGIGLSGLPIHVYEVYPESLLPKDHTVPTRKKDNEYTEEDLDFINKAPNFPSSEELQKLQDTVDSVLAGYHIERPIVHQCGVLPEKITTCSIDSGASIVDGAKNYYGGPTSGRYLEEFDPKLDNQKSPLCRDCSKAEDMPIC